MFESIFTRSGVDVADKYMIFSFTRFIWFDAKSFSEETGRLLQIVGGWPGDETQTNARIGYSQEIDVCNIVSFHFN